MCMNKGTQNETVTEKNSTVKDGINVVGDKLGAQRYTPGAVLHRTFKILMVGEASVGKTAIATRYVDQKFDHSMTATIGVDFKKKEIDRGEKIVLQLWDTAGQEKYRSMTASYYRGLAGAVIMFDVTNRKSFENVKMWLADIEKQAPPTVVRVLAGNKIDKTKREVGEQEAQQLATENNLFYVETSALDNTNVDALFDLLTDQILAQCS